MSYSLNFEEMSGTGEVTGIQWTCDNCFTKFNSFKSFHLHRNRYCILADRPSRKRNQLPKRTNQLDSLEEEYQESSHVLK